MHFEGCNLQAAKISSTVVFLQSLIVTVDIYDAKERMSALYILIKDISVKVSKPGWFLYGAGHWKQNLGVVFLPFYSQINTKINIGLHVLILHVLNTYDAQKDNKY